MDNSKRMREVMNEVIAFKNLDDEGLVANMLGDLIKIEPLKRLLTSKLLRIIPTYPEDYHEFTLMCYALDIAPCYIFLLMEHPDHITEVDDFTYCLPRTKELPEALIMDMWEYIDREGISTVYKHLAKTGGCYEQENKT